MDCVKISGCSVGRSTKSAAVLLLTAVLFATSCGSTRTATAERSENSAAREHFREVTKIDSVTVYRHDSVFIRERADTVFVDRYHTKISYRDRLRTDTVRITDTVRTVHSETVAVEVNRLTGWQRFQLRCGQFLIMAVFLTALYLFFKWKLKS